MTDEGDASRQRGIYVPGVHVRAWTCEQKVITIAKVSRAIGPQNHASIDRNVTNHGAGNPFLAVQRKRVSFLLFSSRRPSIARCTEMFLRAIYSFTIKDSPGV